MSKDKSNKADKEKGEICTPKPTNPRGNGIKIKGTGAATKGTRARGPMA